MTTTTSTPTAPRRPLPRPPRARRQLPRCPDCGHHARIPRGQTTCRWCARGQNPCTPCRLGNRQGCTGVDCYRCDCGCKDRMHGVAGEQDMARTKRSKRGR